MWRVLIWGGKELLSIHTINRWVVVLIEGGGQVTTWRFINCTCMHVYVRSNSVVGGRQSVPHFKLTRLFLTKRRTYPHPTAQYYVTWPSRQRTLQQQQQRVGSLRFDMICNEGTIAPTTPDISDSMLSKIIISFSLSFFLVCSSEYLRTNKNTHRD